MIPKSLAERRASLRRNEDFIQLFAHEPLAFSPGKERRYCNPCYVLLGAIVARASGQSYYDYVREHIFRPAGMDATDSYALDSLPENTAVGYTRGVPGSPSRRGPLRPNTDLLPGRGSAAGGGYSTARDLLRFATAVRQGRIPGGPPAAFSVAGGAPGVNALIESGLAGRYTLVVLANLDPPAAEQIGARVRDWLGVRDAP
jgi:D-alanyl-D-alanine carboxypeptidase